MRRALEAYLDGEADAASAASVYHHLGGCWACSEEAECLLLIKAALAREAARSRPELALARLGRYASSLPYRF